MAKVRLDILVQRRAEVSRSKAQGLIHTGRVRTPDGRALDRPGQEVDEAAEIVIEGGPKYVSRGGEKLEVALQYFNVNVQGAVALDAGASTGGFTDCLLQHGAARVFAVDVGYGQLDWRLRQDPRVVVLERTNIRYLEANALDAVPGFFTVDCSFISLRLVLEAVGRLIAPNSRGIALIKPQFEAGPESVGKGGVVRDPAVHERVVEEVRGQAESLGFACRGVIPSPLLGPAGNKEFLIYLEHAPRS